MTLHYYLPYNLIYLFLLCFLVFFSCKESSPKAVEIPINTNWKADAQQAAAYHASMQRLTDVIVHDIFSPPVASRIYAYASIAGYEALQAEHTDYQSLAKQLTDLSPLPTPKNGQEYCYPLASLQAFLTVSKALIFSEKKIETFQAEWDSIYQNINMPADVYDRSKAFGDTIAQHILAWADKDMYKQTRTYPKYAITDDIRMWKPTPPDYMDGIEPHWREIRPFVLDSAKQFVPLPPTDFSLDKNSRFYKEMMEVYEVLKIKNEEERQERLAIAKFWDCNPYVSTHSGHVMFATKKITPGGHWIGITKIATQKLNANMMETANAYARVSIALADGFISCWDEKYRSNLIRPETVINTHLDENWRPALQTPPFPEHTSGHSVISRAAAVTLTDLFGENFDFVDDTEVTYGLPIRAFPSFYAASEEAAISRLYGGIHYRPAIDYGVEQGQKVGEWVVANLKTKK